MSLLPVLSLFSGAGGLDLGFEKAGFSPLLALDIDPAAIQTYNWNRRNANNPAIIADLSKLHVGKIVNLWKKKAGKDVPIIGIIGGPPCQAFSISNVYKVENDPRAKLPLRYAHMLKELQGLYDIKFFLFENVAALGQKTNNSSLKAFEQSFTNAGFDVMTYYIDAVRFSVPQYRRRMFIIGFNIKYYKVADFLLPTGSERRITVRESIGHVHEPLYFSRKTTPREVGLHPNHWCMNPRSPKFGNGMLKSGEMPGRSLRMLDWDSPSWTVAYGHREVHVHPNGKRRLSVFEAMLLQGFPPEYELRGTLSDQIRLISDAVPPPLAYDLAKAINKFINYPSIIAKANKQSLASGQDEQNGFVDLHILSPRSTSP